MATDGNGSPWWGKLAIQQTPAWIFMMVVLAMGWRYLDVSIASQASQRDEMSVFLKAQVETTRSLVEASSVEREFERQVNEIHSDQIDVLKNISSQMIEANKMMAPVPKLRQQELDLLTEIRDGIKNGH